MSSWMNGLLVGLVCMTWAVGCAMGLVEEAKKPAPTPASGPIRVDLRPTPDGGWQLYRGGEPYWIQGAGGNASMDLLKSIGGNSVRTWGADELRSILDEAHARGMTVSAGIWLGHARHGFKYDDPNAVRQQYERATQVIDRYKDHPALLLWSIGNEADGYEADGGDERVWKAIEEIAAYAKRVDPNHPTMTVVAEVLPARIEKLNRLCPSIDILGINTYAGCSTIAKRYKEAGGVKPYIIAEFGPVGTWEVPKTDWGAVPEPTSTEKANQYRESYEKGILAQRGKMCLGSYVFLWGNKQEATSTWFGMFLPDGSRTASVDMMQRLWSGREPANAVPEIVSFSIDTTEPEAGAILRAKVVARDRENDTLTAEWSLVEEAEVYGVGGDAEPVPLTVEDALIRGDSSSAEFRMPNHGGRYRVKIFLRDGHGGAATANIPLRVRGEPAPAKNRARPATLPLVIYDDRLSDAYAPSGWIGVHHAISLTPDHPDNPKSGRYSLRCGFDSREGFGGVVWQNPPNDWGDAPGGFDLRKAKRLTFWARGDRGGEVVSFSAGVLGDDKKFRDSARIELPNVTLTPDWKQYSIDVAGLDLSIIKTGFAWSTASRGEPVVFYLDDVRYE